MEVTWVYCEGSWQICDPSISAGLYAWERELEESLQSAKEKKRKPKDFDFESQDLILGTQFRIF